MTRTLLRSRRLMAVSVLLLLAGVVVLSAATRKPCFHACSAPWHVWKAGHMTGRESREISKLGVPARAGSLPAQPHELPAAPSAIDFPHEETIPPINSIVVQIRHFRSPPTRS